MKTLTMNILSAITLSFVILACTNDSDTQPNVVVPPVVAPPTPTDTIETGFTISQGLNQTGEATDLELSAVYTSSSQNTTYFKPLPSGFNDQIKSFVLPKGYMVTFAENQNGTGESICYVAVTSAVKENLPARLIGKVSFVRYLPIRNVNKKGVCQTNINDVTALKGAWFYNWGLGASSTQTQQYVPMTWGRGAATTENALAFIPRTDIDHLLSFNEPDNANQSGTRNGFLISDAIADYKVMLQTGLRMVSPAVEQDNSTASTDWLPMFMDAATAQKLRVDVIALHWYDWGNQTNNKATDELTADAVLTRFKNYVTKLHAAYPNQMLWFTEYNCNPARSEAVHKLFMKASAEYLNSLPYVERYAYFFPSIYPPTSGAPDYILTPMGKAWLDIASPSAYSSNIIPK